VPTFTRIQWRASSPPARLRDVVVAVRADEAEHRDVNHGYAEQLRPLSPFISTGRA
jgi:ubiquinol oxidase